MNILNRRNAKYSSASAAFTAVVILLVMLANAIFTLLASRFPLYADLTSSELWTLSDTAKEAISMADGEITITFCHERDYIEAHEDLVLVSNTANEIAKEFKGKVHIRYVNSKLHPDLLKGYKYTTDSTIRETDVIVEKGNALKRAVGEQPEEFRKLAYNAFLVTDTNSGKKWAYNGEEMFAAACLAVTADETPTAYFTMGHGESIDGASIAPFYNTITMAGYNTGFIDLVTDEIPEDCRLLIINDPKRDFAGYSIYDPDAVSEIAKIDKYLDGNNTLMVFKNPDTEYLKNLEEFLYEWGIVFGDGVVTDTANSITADGKAIVATYPTETLGASLQKEISGQAAPPRTIVKYASPIVVPDIYTAGIDDDNVATNTYVYSGNNAYRELSAVLTASPSAVLANEEGVIADGGSYNLMTITRDLNVKDNEEYYSYVMAAGTKYFTSADYLESNTYGNKDILYYAFRMMGREKVPANIDFKVFNDTKLEGMTVKETIYTTVFLATALPIVIAACGIVINTRRKYR